MARGQAVTPPGRVTVPAPQIRAAGMHRLICIVPWTGAGTAKDPRRPLVVPAEGLPAGVAGYSVLSSDDGRFAIVEMWAAKREALLPVLDDRRPEVRVFEPARHTKEQVETAVRGVRAGFAIGALPAPAQEVRP